MPFTLFVVALLTVMLTAALVRVRVDLWSATSSSDLTQALAIAQSGLQAYLGSATARPSNGQVVRVNFPGGYADVVAHTLRRPADSLADWTYFVRSTGYVIEPTLGAEPRATRTVGQVAEWQGTAIRTLAALTAVNGVDYAAGPTIAIVGTDLCGGDGRLALRAPAGSDSPLDAADSAFVEIGGAWARLAEETGIDWEATVGGFLPDHTAAVPSDTAFGAFLLRGDAYLEDISGTGLLIVTGELDTQGSFFEWQGIVLVGGEFDPDAKSTVVRGMVVSGLNQLLGDNVQRNDFTELDHDVYLWYDSCAIRRALERFGGFAAIDNAWVEYWASY